MVVANKTKLFMYVMAQFRVDVMEFVGVQITVRADCSSIQNLPDCGAGGGAS